MNHRGHDFLKKNYLPLTGVQVGSLVGRIGIGNIDGHISEVLGELGVVLSINKATNNVRVWYFNSTGALDTRLESLVLISK